MLTLKECLHLPQLDRAVAEFVDDKPGLVMVAGLDPRLAAGSEGSDGFLPNGRATFFRILMREILEHKQPGRWDDSPALIVAPSRNNRLSREVMQLALGDRLVLLSDGLTDAQSPSGKRDRSRLRDLLLERANLAPTAMCAAIFQRLATYPAGTEQYDDMTLLVMTVHATTR